MLIEDHDRDEARLMKLMNLLAKINPNIYKECSIPIASGDNLAKLEEEFPELVIAKEDEQWTMTVPALIATITDILCDKKLAFQVDKNHLTKGFLWLRN